MRFFIFIACSCLLSCNITSPLDKPSTIEEKNLDAQAKIEQGECDEAIATLEGASPSSRNDDSHAILGWAYLCKSNIFITNVGGSLFSYSSTSSDPTIAGALANELIPKTESDLNVIDQAIASFGNILSVETRAVYKSFAYIIKAAAIIAKASGDGVSVQKLDIAPSGCEAIDCLTVAVAACTEVNMSDDDANAVVAALANAANTVAAVEGIGTAKELSTDLNPSGIATALASRCYIFNNLLAE